MQYRHGTARLTSRAESCRAFMPCWIELGSGRAVPAHLAIYSRATCAVPCTGLGAGQASKLAVVAKPAQ